MKILVTGASGFVGRHLATSLRAAGHEVLTAGYSSTAPVDFRIELSPGANWGPAVSGCEAVVHAGARAHVFGRIDPKARQAFEDVNTAGTQTLARAAAAAGVSRFVFISSIAASGTSGPIPIRETDEPRPTTAYGQSKLAAEREITAVAASSHLQTVCLRPPLVYGPDARGRFGQVLRWCNLGLPLPFGGLDNPRSYLSVHNLAAAVLLCLEHPGAAGTVFNIADDQALSMPQLVRLVCEGLGKPCRLFAVPPPLLRASRAFGLQQSIDKLAETMLLDTTRIRDQLNWQPPIAAEAGIRTAAEQFLRQKTTRS